MTAEAVVSSRGEKADPIFSPKGLKIDWTKAHRLVYRSWSVHSRLLFTVMARCC